MMVMMSFITTVYYQICFRIETTNQPRTIIMIYKTRNSIHIIIITIIKSKQANIVIFFSDSDLCSLSSISPSHSHPIQHANDPTDCWTTNGSIPVLRSLENSAHSLMKVCLLQNENKPKSGLPFHAILKGWRNRMPLSNEWWHNHWRRHKNKKIEEINPKTNDEWKEMAKIKGNCKKFCRNCERQPCFDGHWIYLFQELVLDYLRNRSRRSFWERDKNDHFNY